MARPITFVLNGSTTTLDAGDWRSLLAALRTDRDLTGTKYGCGAALCGACTVLVAGEPQRACVTPLESVAAKEVVTIEGLATRGTLSALQQAFIDHGAFQCGFCTPGMLLEATALLRRDPHPSRATIIATLDHHLCRCGAHQRIVAAIESVSVAGGARP